MFARLNSDPAGRPLFQKNDSFDNFKALLNTREKFYIEADLQLKVCDENPRQVAKKILDELPSVLRPPEDLGAPQTIER